MLEEYPVICPYCAETITLVIDPSAGQQSYVEDCFVCCQPIVVTVETDSLGEIEAVTAQSENV